VPLVEMNWDPPPRQLRQFGALCAVVLPALAWRVWGGNSTAVLVAGALGLAAAVTGWFAPRALKPVFIALSLVALPIGRILAEVAMLLMFCLVFLPIGLVFRLAGREGLHLRLDRSATTYWQPKLQPKSVASYYRQF